MTTTTTIAMTIAVDYNQCTVTVIRTNNGRCTQRRVRLFDTAEKAQCFADGIHFALVDLDNQ